MKDENKKALENLSKTAHWSGILPIFLGILIGFIGVIQGDVTDIVIGLFVLIVGYSYVKIAQKLNNILSSEDN